jgi:hypothetical protein
MDNKKTGENRSYQLQFFAERSNFMHEETAHAAATATPHIKKNLTLEKLKAGYIFLVSNCKVCGKNSYLTQLLCV